MHSLQIANKQVAKILPRLVTLALLVIGLSACQSESVEPLAQRSAAQSKTAEVLFINGNIHTFANNQAHATTLVVGNNRITAIGNAKLATSYKSARVIDLAGATLMPGFNDTHIHISGDAQRYIDLTELTSIQQLQALVRERAALLGDNEWITGYGWSEDELAEDRKPSRADLDRAAPNNPVVLTRAGAHSAVANSMALKLAGLTRESPDPQNGSLERDAAGELTGVVRERQDLLLALVPPASEAELELSLQANLQRLFSLGITSITQAMSEPQDFARWRRVYSEHAGQLPRASVQVSWPGKDKFNQLTERSGDGDEHFRIGPLKVFVDGGFTGPAAYTKAPYRGETSYRGKLALTETELTEIIETAHTAGWQLGIHAIGDAAIELTVDKLAAALAANPRADHRHYLNHFTVMPSHATMQTMADNDIWVTQQPNFTYTLEGRYVEYLDGERLAHNNALRTPMDHGIFMAISSDILPIGPMVGVYAAVTRRGMSGRQFGPEEALTVREALRGYTKNAAFFTTEEGTKGTLEVGKLADFIVLDADPLALDDPADLLKIGVQQTWLGGKQVYSALAE